MPIIAGMQIYDNSVDTLISHISKVIHDRQSLRIHTVNMNHLTTLAKSRSLFEVYNSADIITNDSAMIVRISKLKNKPLKNRITGVSLVERLLMKGEIENLKVGIIGSSEQAITLLKKKLVAAGKKDCIVLWDTGEWTMPADDVRLSALIQKVRNSDVNMIFSALGMPKQEMIMYQLAQSDLKVVQIGIGGSIDMLAGVQPYWPNWVDRLGMIALWRFFHAPKKIGSRLIEDIFTASKLIVNDDIYA